MPQTEKPDSRRSRDVLGGRAMLLLFGLGVLGYLVAIDRAEWFVLKPATGTSLAMAHASTDASAPTTRPQATQETDADR